MASIADNRAPWQKVKQQSHRLKEDAGSGINQYGKQLSDAQRDNCVEKLKELAKTHRAPDKFEKEVESIENDVQAGIRRPSTRKFGTKVKKEEQVKKEEVKEELLEMENTSLEVTPAEAN